MKWRHHFLLWIAETLTRNYGPADEHQSDEEIVHLARMSDEEFRAMVDLMRQAA